MSLNGTPGRFIGKHTNILIKKNQEKQNFKISNIKSQLVGKTFADIKNIVKNIGDHPHQNKLIQNLENCDSYENTKKILAIAIKNSTHTVEKILNIK